LAPRPPPPAATVAQRAGARVGDGAPRGLSTDRRPAPWLGEVLGKGLWGGAAAAGAAQQRLPARGGPAPLTVAARRAPAYSARLQLSPAAARLERTAST
jgi:hypothetical protein